MAEFHGAFLGPLPRSVPVGERTNSPAKASGQREGVRERLSRNGIGTSRSPHFVGEGMKLPSFVRPLEGRSRRRSRHAVEPRGGRPPRLRPPGRIRSTPDPARHLGLRPPRDGADGTVQPARQGEPVSRRTPGRHHHGLTGVAGRGDCQIRAGMCPCCKPYPVQTGRRA